jgi:hypothetical protein
VYVSACMCMSVGVCGGGVGVLTGSAVAFHRLVGVLSRPDANS